MGAGIDIGRDLTPSARWHIAAAGKVFFLVADPVAAESVLELNANAESLHTLYDVAKPRIDTYHQMVERVLASVRTGSKVCVVAYGHPGIFAYPMHKAVKDARAEGYTVAMLPGISSIDCLLTDLYIDPAADGLQIFDASDLLFSERPFSVTTPLVLLQVAVVGDPGFKEQYGREGVTALADYLSRHYGSEHDAVVYQASQYSDLSPSIQHTTVAGIARASVNTGSTLYIPPKPQGDVGEATR